MTLKLQHWKFGIPTIASGGSNFGIAAAFALLALTTGQMAPSVALGQENPEPTTPEEVLGVFHSSLQEGAGKSALQWLAKDAIILESGVAESAQEYASHHLHSDMAFLAGLQSERLSRAILRAGDAVTVVTRTRLTGTYDGEAVDMLSAETAVLIRTDDGWRIQHLHWSN